MKILASDYDGTLRSNPILSDENIKAIHRFRQAGHAFGIVTGRSMESIKSEIEKYQLEVDFLVTNNGGMIYDEKYTNIKDSFIAFDAALRLIEYIRTLHCASFVINDGYRRCRIVLDEKQKDIKYGNIDSTLTFEEVLEKKKIAQIVVSLDDDSYAHKIAEIVNKEYKGYVSAYVNVNCIDIVPYEISKGKGLQFIEEYKHYVHDDIYAIGDSFNDIPMLEAFHGMCVSHSQPEIKAKAEKVVDEVSDAIAYLMKISS